MESKGFQVLSNLLKEPLRENLNLSSFKLCKTSLIHLSYDGGKACFQLSKINRLASRVQKAKECCASAVRECCHVKYQKGQTKDLGLIYNGRLCEEC